MNTWHILTPISFLVGLVLIGLSLWLQNRRDRKWRVDFNPQPDDRDWHGAFMRDVKTTPRKCV